jgi:hypothetical protein
VVCFVTRYLDKLPSASTRRETANGYNLPNAERFTDCSANANESGLSEIDRASPVPARGLALVGFGTAWSALPKEGRNSRQIAMPRAGERDVT